MPNVVQTVYPQEWRDQYLDTPYPFFDEATLSNGDGVFIPEGTFQDAAIYPIGARPLLRLSKIVVTANKTKVYVGDDTNDELCYGIIDIIEPKANIRLVDKYSRPSGVLVSAEESLLVFQSWPQGTHKFNYSQTGFVSDVCLPTPAVTVRGFLLDDGELLTGDVWFVGSDGVVLNYGDYEPPQNCAIPGFDAETQRVIRVDVVGNPLYRRGQCGELFENPQFIRTITVRKDCAQVVCTPDDSGNFSLLVTSNGAEDTVLRAHAENGGIRFETIGQTRW